MDVLARVSNQSEIAIPIGAGLTTLRTVTRWHCRGLGDAIDALSLRMAVGQIDVADPLAAPLQAIAETLASLFGVEAARPDSLLTDVRASLARHLHAYGIELERRSLPGAARDAYTLMRALAESVAAYGAREGVALTHASDVAWARAALAEGSIDDAADAYAALARRASDSRQCTAIADAALGLAAVAEARHDWRTAGDALEGIFALAAGSEADRVSLQPYVTAARRAQARVAMAREDWPAAARALNACVLSTDDDEAQDLLLTEFAGVLVRMRALAPARAIFECLSDWSEMPEVRWRSDLALLAIHAASGNALSFERCRRRLFSRTLPAHTRAEVLFAAAHGYGTLRDSTRAAHAYRQLQRFARDNGLASLANAAAGALEDMSRSAAARPASPPVPDAEPSLLGPRHATGHLQVVRAADAPESVNASDEWAVMARAATARRTRAPAPPLTPC